MSLERLLAGEEGVFREAPAATTAPHILKSEHSSFTLIVDGESIISVNDAVEAALAFVMMHSVFNLKFARRSASFGLFIQRIVGVDDGVKMPSKAVNLFRRLD